jgi:UDP-N-acetylmuramoyl-tripeptide--D-alanyl-D-alanine ligase
VATFGAGDRADARLVGCQPDADGSEIEAEIGGIRKIFRVNAPGRHMAMNAVAALAASVAAGADLSRAVAALAHFAPVQGRGVRQTIAVPGGGALLLDESYNASAASVRAALAVLRLQPAGRRIAVLGDMLELGADGPAEHAGLAPDIATNADLLFACGPLMRWLYHAIPASHRGAYAADAAALAPIVAEALLPGDAVLVKGSLGSRMKTIVSALTAAPSESR